jgi:hypothetical protein
MKLKIDHQFHVPFVCIPVTPTGDSEDFMQRMHIHLTPQQVTVLRARYAETGIHVSEQIRQAINLAIFGDQQSTREATRQPVLISRQ